MEPPWTTSSDGDRWGLDDLVGDLDVGPGEQGGEDDHDHAQPDEQDGRVRHLVPAALDRAEDALHHGSLGGNGFRCGRHDAPSPVPTDAA